MEDAQRWNATYTNQVKQKRKVYHDGFLVLQPSRHKVMLYDEWEKLLETRFVKKDDVIKSGETVTFNSYLVDIGELCGGHQSTSNFDCQEKDRKSTEKIGSSYSNNSQSNQFSVDRRPMFVKSKARGINLSPSHRMIRDFKKSEMNKSGSSPNCMDMTDVFTREWLVLYTNQKTQKTKKFHDGFLELIARGLQGRQVKLYDINRRHLDSRFLKKDEIVCSGESLVLDGHLVEIGEQEGDNKPLTETPQGKNYKVVGKTSLADQPAKVTTNKKFHAGETPDNISLEKLTNLNDSSSKNSHAKSSWGNAEPRRAVTEILKPGGTKNFEEILIKIRRLPVLHIQLINSLFGDHRQPSERKVDRSIKPFTDDLLELHLSDSQTNTERHIQVTSSSFCLRSERTNSIGPSTNLECSNLKELISNSSSVESHLTLNFEDQMPIESAKLTRPIKIEKPENPTKMCPHEEIMTEKNAAGTNNLGSIEFPELWEELNGSKSGCHEAACLVSIVASNDCKSHDVKENTPEREFHTTELDTPEF